MRHLASAESAPTGLAYCPLDRVLTYKNFYLLNLQFKVFGNFNRNKLDSMCSHSWTTSLNTLLKQKYFLYKRFIHHNDLYRLYY